MSGTGKSESPTQRVERDPPSPELCSSLRLLYLLIAGIYPEWKSVAEN